MSANRITDLVVNLQEAELTRRDLLVKAGVAGMTATALSAFLSARALAAPGSTSSRFIVNQIDATTLVIADTISGGDWLTLDPAWYYEINPTMAMYVIYEALYHSPDGSDPTGIEPMLADGLPVLSEDLLTATVKLKQGVKFQTTGNEMTADDVVFSYQRLAATQFQPSFLATDYWTEVKKVDDYTGRIHPGVTELRSRRGACVYPHFPSPTASKSSNSAERPTHRATQTTPRTTRKPRMRASPPTRTPKRSSTASRLAPDRIWSTNGT